MENNNIIIMPVVRKRPWVNTDSFNKNKLGGASTVMQPYFGENGFQTGLEGQEELQAQFEKELGLEKGSLEPIVTNEYWSENMNIKLEDGPTIFKRALPMDRLKLLILKNHPKVALSINEVTPDNDFYIVDEVLESERKATKTEKKSKAYGILVNMSPEEQRQFIKLFGKGGPDMNEMEIKADLGELIEQNVDEFISKSEFSKEKIHVRAFIFDLVTYNILRIRGGHYFDSDEDKGDLEVLTSYFLAPEKQDVYLNYKERLDHAKRGN